MLHRHKKEHNFSAILFTAIVLVAVLAGGAKGHIRRETAPVIIENSAVVQEGVSAKPKALLIEATQTPAMLPSISAASALVEDIDSKKVLYEFNSERQWSAASLTKLVTALSAMESLSEEQLGKLNSDEESMIKVSPTAIATESSAGNLVSGRAYRLEELLRAMLVFSSNDAATAISEWLGKDSFIEFMNKTAKKAGMVNTRFFDPHGLTPLNLTTAKDLEHLVGYIYNKQSEILEFTREKIEGATHPFAGQDDFLGGKTGFIDESAGNLISLFQYRGQPIVIIVLGSKQRAEDTQILKDWFLPQ